MKKKVAAVILAGGSGQRLGAEKPKQFIMFLGRSMLEHCVLRFDGHPLIDEIVLVVPAAFYTRSTEIFRNADCDKLKVIVCGGATRQASAAAGIAALSAESHRVLIHDAARPLVKAELITRVVHGLDQHKAVIPVVPVADTLVRVNTGGRAEKFLDRSELFCVQTPQGFHRDVISRAHELAAAGDHMNATDDSSLIKNMGLAEIFSVPGSCDNFKITYPEDLNRALCIMKMESHSNTEN